MLGLVGPEPGWHARRRCCYWQLGVSRGTRSPTLGRLARGIPPADLWATDPGGIEQVGCIYTAQGFEVDYIGVIWGKDLAYDFDGQSWVGNKNESRDRSVKQSKTDFLQLVKNTYRVLLSRGMKGCFVCFLDKDTERFVRSRMDLLPVRMVAESTAFYGES